MKYLLLFLIWFSTNDIFSQNTISDTDRPDYSNTPFTIGKKNVQSEIGYSKMVTQGYNKPYRDIIYILPILIKYGVRKNLDIHIGVDYQKEKDIVSNGVFSGKLSPNFLLGFKCNFVKQDNFVPTISLRAHLIQATKFHFKVGIDTVFIMI